MNAPASIVRADDSRWGCRSVIEIASESFDNDRVGIGSSPYVGDMGAPGVPIPPAAVAATNRYLVRLCGVEIPTGRGIIIRGLRQGATIRHVEAVSPDPGVLPLIVEREIVSPFWSFLDGNISWHLRWQDNQVAAKVADAAQPPGATPQLRGLDTSLTYTPPILPYVPPAGGIPPGQAVGDLSTFYDIRYPWTNTDWSLAHQIVGPGAVIFWASVRQPNTTSRPIFPDNRGMRPEDQFVSAFPFAVYGRVAGAMIVEMFPCCADGGPVIP